MQEPAGFEAFVTARGDALHDSAYLMTGDHAAAEDLVQMALAKAWPAWRRIAADPETFVRAAIAESYAPPWHRGSSREPVVELAVDGEHLAEPADPVDRPDVAPEDRIDAVRRLVTTRQQLRRRVVAGALVVVLVGAAIIGAKSLQQQRHPAPHASKSVRPEPVVDPPAARVIPTYYNGGKELSSFKVDLSREGSTTLRFTPTRWGLDFAYQCPTQMSGSAQFEIRVKGFVILGSDCVGSDPGGGIGGPQVVALDGASGDYGESNLAAEAFWSALGITLGRPATAQVTVRRAGFAASPPPAMTVVVYQDVPFTDYPLPTRPDDVQPPTDIFPPVRHPEAITLPGDLANGTWTRRLAYRRDLAIDGSVSGPGQIQIRVDGVLVGGYDSYGYDVVEGFTRNIGPPWPRGLRAPEVGQPITVTVTLEHFTGPDWSLHLGRAAL